MSHRCKPQGGGERAASSTPPVKYIGYYDCSTNAVENRLFVVAATNKMDYILTAMNRAGRSVVVVSVSHTRDRVGFRSKTIELGSQNALILFRTIPWGGPVRRLTSRVFMRLQLFTWLLRNVDRHEDVLVYHSLAYALEIAAAKRIRKFNLILEVEEVYGDVSGIKSHLKREERLFRHADAFILPTGLMNGVVNVSCKPYAIVHGTYGAEPQRPHLFDDGRIHVVYAGTFAMRKGVSIAVRAARFLDECYHLHILGFGTPAEVSSLQELMQATAAQTSCRLTYHGLLTGEQFTTLIQSCQIGLSTQTPEAAFNETSFPSKVLSYLANGLHVVSIRLRALEDSGVCDLLHFYDDDTPEALADAIRLVDLKERYDSRARLADLDDEFVRALRGLLCG